MGCCCPRHYYTAYRSLYSSYLPGKVREFAHDVFLNEYYTYNKQNWPVDSHEYIIHFFQKTWIIYGAKKEKLRPTLSEVICHAPRARDQLSRQNPQNSTLTALNPFFGWKKNTKLGNQPFIITKKIGNIFFTEFNDISFIMCTSG